MLEDAKYQITIRTSDFRGDHATDIEVAIDVPPETTIQELVCKVFNGELGFKVNKTTDWLVIRPTNPFNYQKEEPF